MRALKPGARRAIRALLAVSAVLLSVGPAFALSVPLESGLRLELVASGLRNPVHCTAPPGDDRLFIVEQLGRVRILRDGKVLDRPFLDLSRHVSHGYERGLLSIAFHPRYAQNGEFFVSFTDTAGDSRIERYRVSRDPDLADSTSGELVITAKQPYPNHNGGLIVFGPDGMLYLGLGDGGLGGDPHRNGQNLNVLLGKILRLDVDSKHPYAIPPDNPFAGKVGKRGEIWAYGLRNPWRFAFDEPSGKLFLADDGEWSFEEVNVIPAGTRGLNFGWSIFEAHDCFRGRWCNPWGITMPVVEYTHKEGCTIIGGMVYHGKAMRELDGHYFYSDHCHGWIRSFKFANGRVTQHRQWKLAGHRASTSFGTDGHGEMYLLSLDGEMYRLAYDGPAAAAAR
jgi:glucose/arabinose dehydrogenase